MLAVITMIIIIGSWKTQPQGKQRAVNFKEIGLYMVGWLRNIVGFYNLICSGFNTLMTVLQNYVSQRNVICGMPEVW